MGVDRVEVKVNLSLFGLLFSVRNNNRAGFLLGGAPNGAVDTDLLASFRLLLILTLSIEVLLAVILEKVVVLSPNSSRTSWSRRDGVLVRFGRVSILKGGFSTKYQQE